MKHLLPQKVFVIALLLVSASYSALYGQEVMDKSAINAPYYYGSHMPVNNGDKIKAEDISNGHQLVPHKQNGPQNAPGNYKTFSKSVKNISSECMAANKGYEKHPEIGLLYEGAPCNDCYELISERTETTKTFYKEGKSGKDGGKDIMEQTSTAPMHYKDANGNWITIKTLLEPDNYQRGIYAASEQPVPVVINTNDGNTFSSLGKKGALFQFNHNLELVFVKPDGSEHSLGVADWKNHTAGDDGVYVTNAWPGIDIEMHTHRGAIKTNFYINHALPEYADGQLLLRDHLVMDNDLSLFTDGKTKSTDNLEIRNKEGEKVYVISSVIACEKKDPQNTLHVIDYNINGNILDIVIPGTELNKAASSYPVIIDPLVSTATAVAVGGSTYSAALAAMSGCLYTDNAVVPPNITITDIRFAFIYTTSGGAWLSDGATDFYLYGCRSPAPPTGFGGLYWFCNFALPGTCTADGTQPYSLLNDFTACVPAPQCPTYTLPVRMYFYETYLTKPPCSTTYVTSASPLTVTVYGHTVEINPATATATTICLGQSTTLSTSAGTVAGVAPYTFGPFTTGVPPYTFTWMPGGLTGATVTVSPATTTTYTVTITDACGITASTTITVVVNIVAPITGTLSLCVGNTTTLADATGGAHTWVSSTPGVATITSPGGVVTAIAAGTTTITYTSTATGCYATAVVTVTPLPAPITGTLSVCAGSTTSLTDATAGLPWSSSNVAVATVGGTGIVTGVSAGTATITCGGPTCYVTAIVTVNPVSPITGTLTICLGGTSALTDAVAGGTWLSTNTGVATISGTGLVTSVAGGTTTISYTSAAGCVSTAIVTVNPIAPISGTLTICLGGTTTLSDAAGAGTWTSSNTAVATAGLATGVISGVGLGTSTITFVTPGGCTTTAVVTVNPVAPISGTLIICQGSTTTLTDAAGAGTWSSSTTAVATAGLATGVISGIAPGTSTITFVTAAGCTTTAVVTVNATTPITGTTTICAGTTTTLSEVTTGGTWSSTNTAVATITAGTGIVTALTAGTTTISYLLPSGCYATVTFTVINVAAITGTPFVCVGSTTTLNDATAGGTWNSSNVAVATIGIGTGVVSGISAGTSLVTYTSGGGCPTTIVVTVNPLPAAITGVTNVCAGLTTTLSDITGGGAWTSSNTAIAGVGATGIVTGVSAGSATITYKLPTGCLTTIAVNVNPLPNPISGVVNVCVGSSITLSDVLAGGTWISSSTGIATIDIGTGILTGVSAGVTTITYTLPTGCLITAPVTVVALPGAPVTANLDYCQNSTAVSLTATGNNLLWYPSATGGVGSTTAPIPPTTLPGVFIWYVSQNVNGCEGPRAPLQVTVHIHAVFNIVPARPDACQYDTITFSYSGPSFAGITYAWSLPSNGVLSPGASLANSSILMYFDTSLGFNYVTLTVGDGYAPCNVTDSLPMNVYNNHPIATFYVKPNICIGDTISVALSYIGPGVTDYTWNFSGATIISSSSNHGGPFVLTFPAAGVYTVGLTAISNTFCPSVPIFDTVDVHAYPDARIAPPVILNDKTSTLCIGDSVLLTALNFVPQDLYMWSPAHFFEQRNVNRVYGTIQMPGYVYLTVTDPFGCVAKDSVLFNAKSCCLVYFPNAFTPNGDGKNDVFRPVTIGHHVVHEFRIVNRWGQTVFESANETGSWDGNFNGVPEDMGVYYYYYKYDCDGKTMDEKGEVTLIR